MTSEYDELLKQLDAGLWREVKAAAAIRALTAQVVELTTERESILSASEQGEAGGIIKNAREDAAGWAEAAEPLQGREYFAYSGVALTLLKTAGVAERAILRAVKAEEQVVERDAVIEQAPHVDCDFGDFRHVYDPPCTCFKAQVPRDALTARDAVRDKTVRATALRDAADFLCNGEQAEVIAYDGPSNRAEVVAAYIDALEDPQSWLRARADQEEL